MRVVLAITLLATVTGCGLADSQSVSDQCMRVDLFKSCMAVLPAGPKSTVYNDWDEVVEACSSAAYYQSIRRRDQVKMECRP